MKKTLRILLALALALTLVFSIVACGEKENNKPAGNGGNAASDASNAATEPSKDSKADVEDEFEAGVETEDESDAAETSGTAEETLEGFLSAVCEFRLVDAGEYAVDTEAYMAAIFGDAGIPSDVNGIDDAVDALMESLGTEEISSLLGDDFMDFLKNTLEDMLGELSYTYELKEEVSDDEVIYNVVLTAPDFEAAGEIIGNAFNDPAVSEAMMAEVTAMVESGEITEDMSEEELIAAVMPLIIDTVDDVISDALDSVDTVEAEMEAKLVKIDGKWLIQD